MKQKILQAVEQGARMDWKEFKKLLIEVQQKWFQNLRRVRSVIRKEQDQ